MCITLYKGVFDFDLVPIHYYSDRVRSICIRPIYSTNYCVYPNYLSSGRVRSYIYISSDSILIDFSEAMHPDS